MIRRYERQLPLLGEDSPAVLENKTVMICGLGGVGGFILEGLARAGVGKFILIDNDTFDITNLNRQILCTTTTLGLSKAKVAAERATVINPNAVCIPEIVFLNKDNIEPLLEKHSPDYVADAIDNISAKVALAKLCEIKGIPIISSMGTGNKLDPTAFKCTDIYKTSVCPLAKVMRKLLREENVSSLKVVYSEELPKFSGKVVSSVSFVPSVAGMIIAGEILKDLTKA